MVKTRIEESLGANPADAALNPADSVAMGVQSAGVSTDERGSLFQALHRREYRLLFTAFLVNQVGLEPPAPARMADIACSILGR